MAEGRARRVRSLTNIAAGVGIGVFALPCWVSLAAVDSVEPTRSWLVAVQHHLGHLLTLALLLGCVALRLHIVAGRLTHRASTPLTPPTADPLATYREGPAVECPRHPFGGLPRRTHAPASPRVGYARGMSGDAARTIDPELPNLAPDVVEGYRNAPETLVAEIIDGELSLMPRPRLEHARSAGELHGELRGPFDRGRGGPSG